MYIRRFAHWCAVIAASGLVAVGCEAPSSGPSTPTGPAGGKADEASTAITTEIRDNHGRITIRFQFPPARLEASAGETGVRLAGTTPFRGEPGSPVLPRRTYRVVIPAGHEVDNLALSVGSGTSLTAPQSVEHHPGFRPLCEECPAASRPPAAADPAVYGAPAPFPATQASVRSVQRLHGYSLAVVDFYPVQYFPADARLEQATQGELVLTTRLASEPFAWDGRMIGPSSTDLGALARIADDASLVTTYRIPYEVPTAAPAEYLIITSRRFADDTGEWSLGRLLEHRKAHGLTVDMVTREWIDAEIEGRDTQDKIRNYIRQAYQERGTRYVLLAGDSDFTDHCAECETPIVPHRNLYAAAAGEEDEIPADCYYSNLDGTFDDNDNGVYGEPDDGKGAGDVDLMAEVAVGRAPVDSEAEVANFVRKTIAYETGRAPERILLAGEPLWEGIYGDEHMEELWNGSNLASRTTRGFAEVPDLVKTTLYARQQDWDGQEMLRTINNAAAPIQMIHHLGHAINDSNMQLNNSDIASMSNTVPFFQFSQGCYSGAFDNIDTHVSPVDAFAEHLVVEAHGAFASIQNSRYGWGSNTDTLGPSQMYHREFVDALVSGNAVVGNALNEARAQNAWDIDGECMRWCYYETNLLGDPAVELHVELCEPEAVANAGPDQLMTPDAPVRIGAPAAAGTTYLWEPAAGLSCSTCADPIAAPATTTRYTVTATTQCGSAEDSVMVAVDQRPVVEFIWPEPGSVLGGAVSVLLAANDPDGTCDKVVLSTPAGEVTFDDAPPYLTLWDTTVLPDGPVRLTAVATDDQGIESLPVYLDVAVANHSPIPRILSFTAEPEAGTPVTLRWQLADAVGVSLTANRVPIALGAGQNPTGSLVVTPSRTTDYELTACADVGCWGGTRARITVRVP